MTKMVWISEIFATLDPPGPPAIQPGTTLTSLRDHRCVRRFRRRPLHHDSETREGWPEVGRRPTRAREALAPFPGQPRRRLPDTRPVMVVLGWLDVVANPYRCHEAAPASGAPSSAPVGDRAVQRRQGRGRRSTAMSSASSGAGGRRTGRSAAHAQAPPP